MRIGVLVDHPQSADYIQTAFTVAGHRVTIHRDVQTLFTTLQMVRDVNAKVPYDLALIDLHLSEHLSEHKVVARIHRLLGPLTLPIIITPASSASALKLAQLNLPNVIVLSRPFTAKTLLQLVEALDDAREDHAVSHDQGGQISFEWFQGVGLSQPW